MLQIKQLKSTNNQITVDEQKQVNGSGAGPHLYIAPSEEKQEELWSGYHEEDYDIEVKDKYKNSLGTFVFFERNNSRTTAPAGVIKL